MWLAMEPPGGVPDGVDLMGTYSPLATRLRPRVFAEVVGQDATVRILQNAIHLGRIANSYIFSGLAGVGKTTLARIFAAGLNCQGVEEGYRHESEPAPCGACSSCLDVQEGRSQFVIEVDAASDRGVQMVEDLQGLVAQALPDGAWRVFIMDECHAITGKAWGAFLKTIEEPAPHNVFIFVTTDRERVIQTVRSRSSSFVFRPVSAETIVQVLAAAVRDKQLDPSWQGEFMTPDVLAVIAREARGSVRDALHLLDKVVLLGPTTVAEVERLVGIDSETVRDIADAVISLDPRYYFEVVAATIAKGFGPDEMADIVLRVCRDLVVLRAGWKGEMLSYLPADKLVYNARNVDDGMLQTLYREAVALFESRRIDRIALEVFYVRALQKNA